MRWRGERQSENVEDRRGMSGGGKIIGGGLGGLVVLVIALLMGADPRQLLEQAPTQPSSGPQTSRPAGAPEEEQVQFIRVVLASTEDYWTEAFRQMGRQYRKPKLQIFSNRVDSACGVAGASVGPFYCPADEKIYLDLSFFDDLRSRFRAPGDFAQAYVIAHEVGHHVQKLMGTMDKVNSLRGRVSQEAENEASVRLELQADFLAGLWANYAQNKNLLDPDDIDEALGAASAVGDDRLQRESQGYVVPDSFTHGSSEQRIRWFRRGFETGDIRQGDTFSARSL